LLTHPILGNPQNIRPQVFSVSVPGERCGGSQKVVVTIEDGAKLVVGDNTNSPKNTGGLYFTSGSELYAFGSNPITLEDKSELTFDKNSRLELKQGALFLAKANVFVAATESDFVMDNGSKILFESNGDFQLDDTSIDVPPGSAIELLSGTALQVSGPTSVIHIRPGATLRLSGESVANIKPGATLILDPGAIVILESPESRIRIEGTLVWNGDINFSGLGYFEFAWGGALELGPNADAFRLTGAGKQNRFIRIEGAATLAIPNGKGLDLREGAVEHHGEEILLGDASWCALKEVKMYGDGVRGILGHKAGDVVIEDCTFDGLTSPIEILGSDNAGFPLYPLTQVRRTDFHDYHTGAHFRDCGAVLFEDSQFFGSSGEASSGIFSEFNLFTIVSDCTIEDHDADILHSSNDPLVAGASAGMGIKVEGGWVLWMNGGEIRNCEIGIGNLAYDDPETDGAPANVYMSNFATIRNCHTGIAMNGDATTGLVTMDCARIVEIGRTGIYGEDITMVIDPLLLLQQTNGVNVVDPNVFTRLYSSGPPKHYINACYVEKTPPDPLPAKLNFWGDVWGGTTSVQNNPNSGIILKKTLPTGVPCGTSFLADVSQALQDEPLGCARQMAGITPDECLEPVFPNESPTVRQEFKAGLELLKNQEIEQSRTRFGNIAALWQPALPGFSNYCETLIDAAKSLSEGESRSQSGAKIAKQARVFPNPASGEVTVWLPETNVQLRVWDAFGKLIHEGAASGLHRVDASAWPGGLYWFDISSPDGALREQAKVVIQH